jgi:hypothetical protein
MESYHLYRDFGVTYYQLTGTTEVSDGGQVLCLWERHNEMDGKELAHKYIDDLWRTGEQHD